MNRALYALPAFLTAVSFWLAASKVTAQDVTADVCPQKLATSDRLRNQLRTERAAIKKKQAELEQQKAYKDKATEFHALTLAATDAKPGYLWLKNMGAGAAQGEVTRMSEAIVQTQQALKRNRENDERLAKELELEESLAARCLQQAAAAAAAKPPFPNIAGPYNSPYGHTQLRQEQQGNGAYVRGTVNYDKSADTPEGGTSELEGSFDGHTWSFTWRNSYGHYGNGQLTLLEDGTGMKGWWEDKRLSPPKKGDWWLYRK